MGKALARQHVAQAVDGFRIAVEIGEAHLAFLCAECARDPAKVQRIT
jgi:hypothetical protein